MSSIVMSGSFLLNEISLYLLSIFNNKMNKIITSILMVGMVAGVAAQAETEQQKTLKKLQEHYQRHDAKVKSVLERKADELMSPPDRYYMEDYKRTMDPITGVTYFSELAKVKTEIERGKYAPKAGLKLLNAGNFTDRGFDQPWVERGPYAVGGRIRAIAYDPNDPTGRRAFAGSATGGLWVNQDPADANNEWTPLSTFWASTSIHCIAFDPNNSQTMYVGTGEVETGDGLGSGIWKSTDAGQTWQQIFTIPATYSNTVRNGNFFVNDIKIRNVNGTSEIFVGVSGGYSEGWQGLYQSGLYVSTDGGNTFTKNDNFNIVNPNTNAPSNIGYSVQQIEIGADNSVWVSTRASRFSNLPSGGKIFKSTDGVNFTQVYTNGNGNARVNFTISPQNPNVVYALMQGVSQAEPVRIAKTTDGGTTWNHSGEGTGVVTLPVDGDNGIPNNDFTRGQHFYDLVIKVDPNDQNTVYAGGIDTFKSTNGGQSWTQVTKWANVTGLAGLNIPVIHADQHVIEFNPSNTNEMLIGNDGGMYYVPNKNNFQGGSSAVKRNNRLNVTQIYRAALNPTKTTNNEELSAGAQDNGSFWLSTPSLAQANFLTHYPSTSGDGGYTDYDDQDEYLITSYVFNSHYKIFTQGNTLVARNLITSPNDRNMGHFINEMALDRTNDIMYSYRSGLSIFVVPNVLQGNGTQTAPFINRVLTLATAQQSEQISHLKASPYSAVGSSTLYAGTNQGRIIRVADGGGTNPTFTVLNTPGIGSISDIEFGTDEQHIIVTMTNYNINNIYYTTDGGNNWLQKDGNLPDMPVRTALVNAEDADEVIIGTEMGIWGTNNFTSPNPIWAQYASNLGNVRVTDLDYRPSTRTVLAATYGRGVWTTQNSTLSTSEEVNKSRLRSVYPNPSRGNLNVRLPEGVHSATVKMFDASGKLVYTNHQVKNMEEFYVQLAKGAYMLTVEKEGKQLFSTSVIIR